MAQPLNDDEIAAARAALPLRAAWKVMQEEHGGDCPGRRKDETGWVLEHGTAPLMYWAGCEGSDKWSQNHLDAVRFARADDALALIKNVYPHPRAVEHTWSSAACTCGLHARQAEARKVLDGE